MFFRRWCRPPKVQVCPLRETRLVSDLENVFEQLALKYTGINLIIRSDLASVLNNNILNRTKKCYLRYREQRAASFQEEPRILLN